MSVSLRRSATRALGVGQWRTGLFVGAVVAATVCSSPARAQTLTVVSNAVDTLVTATRLTSGVSVVRQMTASITGCERRGNLRTCSAHISSAAGGSTLSANDLRWGLNAAACTNPVAVTTTPPLASTAFPALITLAATNNGSSGQVNFVLCYVVDWTKAPARYTPTLYFRVVLQ